jgi:hypothetical protein
MGMYSLLLIPDALALTMYSYKHPYRDTPTVQNEDIDQGWIRLLHVSISPHGFVFHYSDYRIPPRWRAGLPMADILAPLGSLYRGRDGIYHDLSFHIIDRLQ